MPEIGGGLSRPAETMKGSVAKFWGRPGFGKMMLGRWDAGRRWVRTGGFKGRQFTAAVILWAVHWYLMFPIRYRELELILIIQLFAPAQVADMLRETGFAMDMTRVVGPIILVCAILYAIPATTVLGAILVTGFLGGAICAHVRMVLVQFKLGRSRVSGGSGICYAANAAFHTADAVLSLRRSARRWPSADRNAVKTRSPGEVPCFA
jgi:hypothetical protein